MIVTCDKLWSQGVLGTKIVLVLKKSCLQLYIIANEIGLSKVLKRLILSLNSSRNRRFFSLQLNFFLNFSTKMFFDRFKLREVEGNCHVVTENARR